MAPRCLLCFALSIFLLVGCGGGSQALERRMRDLQERVTAMQNENDRLAERVTSLELERAARATPAPTPAENESAVFERPPLKVVRMAPGQAFENQTSTAPGEPAEGAAPEQPAVAPAPAEAPAEKRPVLRLRGSKGGIRQGSGQPSRS